MGAGEFDFKDGITFNLDKKFSITRYQLRSLERFTGIKIKLNLRVKL